MIWSQRISALEVDRFLAEPLASDCFKPIQQTDRMRVLFPDPETPVSTVSRPMGNRTSIFLRLFAEAPETSIQSFDIIQWPPASSRGMRERIAEALARCGTLAALYLLDVPHRDHFAAMDAGSWPEIDDDIRPPHRLFIVLDDDKRVPLGFEGIQRIEQFLVIPWMQADGWFVENIEDARAGWSRVARRGESVGTRHR